ncbi:MAG: sulfite exporter TauE/SafE family protein [Kiritimatiellia bacterium]|jgi:uncharacterized membrane protein YfcA
MFDVAQITPMHWVLLMVAAFIQGMSKGGVPGLTVMAIPLVAMVIPDKTSTGLVLPMLVVGDLFALFYWRRSVSVRDLLRALPWAVVGVVIGWRMLDRIKGDQMRPIVGVVVLFVLALQIVRKIRTRSGQAEPAEKTAGNPVMRHLYAAFMGSLGGVTTMLANAAGPVIGAYLLSLRLNKATFLGTSAWFFFIVNWIKVPFMVQQKMITVDSLGVNLRMIPALIAGVAAGIVVARRVNQKTFEWLVIILAGLASLKLLF